MKWQTITAEQDEPAFEPIYNLFRRKREPDLYCAAPEDRPVPSFLNGATWEFAGALREGDAPPPGFVRAAADLGSRLNGFHLFQVAGRIGIRDPVRSGQSGIAVKSSSRMLWDRLERERGHAGVAVINPSLRGGRGRLPAGEPPSASAK